MGCLKSPISAGFLEADTLGKDMGSKLSLLEAGPTFHEDLPAEDKGHGMARETLGRWSPPNVPLGQRYICGPSRWGWDENLEAEVGAIEMGDSLGLNSKVEVPKLVVGRTQTGPALNRWESSVTPSLWSLLTDFAPVYLYTPSRLATLSVPLRVSYHHQMLACTACAATQCLQALQDGTRQGAQGLHTLETKAEHHTTQTSLPLPDALKPASRNFFP